MHSNQTLLQNFATIDRLTICEQILQKGKFQLTENERSTEIDRIFKEIVSIIVQRTFNPETNKPYPPQLVEETIR